MQVYEKPFFKQVYYEIFILDLDFKYIEVDN